MRSFSQNRWLREADKCMGWGACRTAKRPAYKRAEGDSMAAPQSRTITWLLAATSALGVVILARNSRPLLRAQARGVAMVRASQRQLADVRQEDERAACESHLAALGQLLDAYAHKPANTK